MAGEIITKLEQPAVQTEDGGIAASVDLRREQVPKAPAGDISGIVGNVDFNLDGSDTVAAVSDTAEPPFLDNTQVKQLYDSLAAQNGEMEFVKGYYEINLVHIDPAKYPHGVLLSSTENPMVLKSDVTITYADGTSVELKAGTQLPNGVQLAPSEGDTKVDKLHTLAGNVEVMVPTEGITVDGKTIKPGGTISGGALVHDGQTGAAGKYLVIRPSVDPNTGGRRWDVYTNSDDSRWRRIEGTDRFYPNPDLANTPTKGVRIPEGVNVSFDPAWAARTTLQEGMILVPDSDGKFRVVSAVDNLETALPKNAVAEAAMRANADAFAARFPDVPLVKAAETKAAFDIAAVETQRGQILDFTPIAFDKAAAVAPSLIDSALAHSEDFRLTQGIKALDLSPTATRTQLMDSLRVAGFSDADLRSMSNLTPEQIRTKVSNIRAAVSDGRRTLARGAAGGLLLLDTITATAASIF